MACRFCDRFWERFAQRRYDWEVAHSNNDDLNGRESEQSNALTDQATEIMAEDPGAAFRLYSAAARAGSVWATEMIAWQYWTGTGVGVELDLADEQYRRAIALGSQMAMIGYARLLDERGEYIASDRVLENGLASDFIPASYWLARLRYERIKTKRTAMEVRPMLEKAAAHGHPGARAELARMKAIGKLGLRNVPDGFRLIFRLAFNSAKEAG